MSSPRFLTLALLITVEAASAQDPSLQPLDAGKSDPVFTTYAASLERSEYLVDEGYHLRFYDSSQALALTSDSAGSWGIGFTLDGVLAHAVGDFAREPVIRQSFANLARFDFEPFHDLQVDATFAVESSRQSILSLQIANVSDRPKRLGIYAFATAPDSGFDHASLTSAGDGLVFGHREPPESWSESPPPEYEETFYDLLMLGAPADAYGGYATGLPALLHELNRGLVSGDLTSRPDALVLMRDLSIAPGEVASWRVVRAVTPRSQGSEPMVAAARTLTGISLTALERQAADLLVNAPRLELTADEEMVYRGALALARQSMLPAEGRLDHNYYVFSREPTWSWGHDGQVFHESLSMLAYVYLDPESAMASQRVFMQEQHEDGYIPYRAGPYVVRTFPVDGERTTSAPFYSWTNWEVYRVARERVAEKVSRRFLVDAFQSGADFVEFLLRERDRDGDGLLEWGGHAVLESVRDSLVPIWDLLGKDDPRAPSLVEALDLNAMVVREMRSLALMANALGEPDSWSPRADRLSELIETTMWDDATGFYYNVDRETNAFVTASGLDLRRMEIIGFLPMWAGVSSPERVETLMGKLTDPNKFWRRFGLPTLAADDPGYQAAITRCCQWNGAVWLEWNYLVVDGLRRFGHDDVAQELGERMIAAATTQLSRNHRFWESYSPDEVKLASPKNYIWDSILARVLIDAKELKGEAP